MRFSTSGESAYDMKSSGIAGGTGTGAEHAGGNELDDDARGREVRLFRRQKARRTFP